MKRERKENEILKIISKKKEESKSKLDNSGLVVHGGGRMIVSGDQGSDAVLNVNDRCSSFG